jgi:hypothetical protein
MWLFAIPNGQWIAGKGQRKYSLVNKYKSEGLTNGVADLFLAEPKNGYHGLFIEMKDKGKTQCSVSDKQREFLNDMNDREYLAVWTSGYEQARAIIEEYLK